MNNRQIIRRIDINRKVYNLIPLHTFLFVVLPISIPLFIVNFVALINNKLSILFIIFSTVVITITIFLCSDLRFGETGFQLLYDLIFISKIEHIENLRKGGKEDGDF